VAFNRHDLDRSQELQDRILQLWECPVEFGSMWHRGVLQTDGTRRKQYSQLHRDIAAHALSSNRTSTVVSRNHGKTTIFMDIALWSKWRHMDKRIMYMSASTQLACEILGELKAITEGEIELLPGLMVPFRECFPELTPVKAAAGSPPASFNVAGRTGTGREPCFFPSSIGSNKAGKHPTDIHFDDLQNEKNSRTYAQRQKVIDYIKQAVPIARNPYKSPICAVMTAWAPDDAYCYLRDHPMWTMVTRGVWDGVNPATGEKDGTGPGPNGSWPLCPSFMTAEEIYKTLDEVGEVFFAAQYLNDPIPAEDALFDKPMIEAFEDLSELAPVGGKLSIPAPISHQTGGQILLWDPVHRLEGQGGVQQKRSLNGLIRVYPVPAKRLGISWLDPSRNVFFITGAWEIPGGTDDACAFVENLVQRDPTIQSIWIEQNAAQETLKPWLEERGRVGGVHLRLQRPFGAKGFGRLQGLATGIRKGYLRVLPDCEGKDLLIRRMMEYPISDSDDMLNAMALLSQVKERRGTIPGQRVLPKGSLESTLWK